MMYKFYIGGELLPVTPGAVTLKTNNKDETVDLINGGTYTVLNPPGLSEWEFEFLLPMTKVPFAQYENGFKAPQHYINHLERLKETCKPFRLIIIRSPNRSVDNLNAYEDTNLEVTLGELSVTEDANEYGFAKHVKISLKQYKTYETTRYSISDGEITIDDSIPRYAIVKDGTYISREGDTFNSIAFSQLGDEKYAEALSIYNDLEFTLDPLPEFTILQIDETEIKKVYDEITVDPMEVSLWEPTTYINGVQNGVIAKSDYEVYRKLIEPLCEVAMIRVKRAVDIYTIFGKIGTELRYVTEEAPFEQQPKLIQFGYLIEGLLTAYKTSQQTDRDTERAQLESDIEAVIAKLISVQDSIEDIEAQMTEIESSTDMEDTLKANVLATYEKLLTELETEERELHLERNDLSARLIELNSLPLGAVELAIGETELEAIGTALDGIKADVVASATVATWAQEIGLLEG